MKSIKVQTPATVANLVCGFDVLGMCLHQPYDVMEVRLLNERKVTIQSADEETALAVEKEMKKIYEGIGIPSNTYVTTINNQGVTVVL